MGHSYQRWRSTQQPGYQLPDSLPGPDGWLVAEPVLHQPGRTGPTTWHELTTRPAFPPGQASNHSLGADPLARLVPVGLLHFSQPAQVADCAAQLAALTHGHAVAQVGAAWVAATMAYLVQGQPLPEAGRLAALHLPPGTAADAVRHALETADTLLVKPKQPHQADWWNLMRQRTTPAALLTAWYHAQRYAEQPAEALCQAALHGSRQAAALTGALLGASLGEAGWPPDWRTALDAGRVVIDVADDLCTRCKSSTFACDEDWWQRYPGG